jgi:hypothetical protein
MSASSASDAELSVRARSWSLALSGVTSGMAVLLGSGGLMLKT